MQISINNFQPFLKHSSSSSSSMYINSFKFTQPIISFHSSHPTPTTTTTTNLANGLEPYSTRRMGMSFSGVNMGKYGISVSRRRKGLLFLVVKSNKNEVDGIKINGETARVLGNLGVAILLTYLSMTGQLGWLIDAIVSIWVIVVLVPVVGIGAFLWWAGRDIVQSSCPNCGNEFQVFKSTLNDELQLCPFCTQPFSVVGNEFVSEPVMFSKQSATFDQRVGDSSARKKKGWDSSMAVVDVEAEIRDVE